MSFINLMANDVWSEADIIRRTEAMIRSEFSLDMETILNRKVLGISIGSYTPTEADLAEIARYDQVAKAAQAAGVDARADMALLLQVFPLEDAQRCLDRPTIAAAWERLQQPKLRPIIDPETGEVTNAEAVSQDAAERAAASSVVQPHLIEGPDGELSIDPQALEAEAAERAAAQAVIDAAPGEVKAIFDLRRNSSAPSGSGTIAE